MEEKMTEKKKEKKKDIKTERDMMEKLTNLLQS